MLTMKIFYLQHITIELTQQQHHVNSLNFLFHSMNSFSNLLQLDSIIEQLPSIYSSFESTVKGMKEYKNLVNKLTIKTTGNETKEEMLLNKERQYERVLEIVERRKTLKEIGNETINIIEDMKKKLKNICDSCEEDGKKLMKANNEYINEIDILQEKIKNDKIEEIMNVIEEKINEIKVLDGKYKKGKERRKKERINYMEYKKEEKDDYEKYCKEICRLFEANNNKRKLLMNTFENNDYYEEIKEIKRKERIRKEEEERTKKEKERRRKEEEERKRKEEEERKRKEEEERKRKEELKNQFKQPVSWIIGKRVKRGPNWRWIDQDGGKGKLGTVQSEDTSGWVRVRWDVGISNTYRWGAENCYDLEVVL